MSEKKPAFVIQKWFCRKCNLEYELTGARSIWKPASPKLKGGFQWREYVCPKCGQIIRVGGFMLNEEKKKGSQ